MSGDDGLGGGLVDRVCQIFGRVTHSVGVWECLVWLVERVRVSEQWMMERKEDKKG